MIVYQAFNSTIADYAVQNQHFVGCKSYNPDRMTWIKTNFLWMMYRCGWCRKDANQTNVLAIYLKKEAFFSYLDQAVPASYEESFGSKNEWNIASKEVRVRLQWDPDHNPQGKKENRRAVQLGLKKVHSFSSGRDILKIVDITDFVKENRSFAEKEELFEELIIPRERVIEEYTNEKIGLSKAK